MFETTIRILGGLLAAYALRAPVNARDAAVLLSKAEELGQAMLFAFDSPTGLPFSTLKLGPRKAYNPTWCVRIRPRIKHVYSPHFTFCAWRMRSPASRL